jgi:mannose-6-phosphate isomerase-like protein (cupin superfamily)
VVRLGVVHGSYHWHSHQQEDEFFYVVEGQLLIDLVDPDDPSSSEATLAPSPSTLVRGW